MSLVNVTSVEVGKNPASVLDGFRFEVVFECLDKLEADLEWKFIYVGSSDDKALDQELDCVVMGPVNRGALKFTFEADAPDFSLIPQDDILGFTIILLTGSYRDEEFIRIGWYVHNLYADSDLQEDPPLVPQLDKMQRILLTDTPRVTRFRIYWDNPKIPKIPALNRSETNEEDDDEELLDSEELASATDLMIPFDGTTGSTTEIQQQSAHNDIATLRCSPRASPSTKNKIVNNNCFFGSAPNAPQAMTAGMNGVAPSQNFPPTNGSLLEHYPILSPDKQLQFPPSLICSSQMTAAPSTAGLQDASCFPTTYWGGDHHPSGGPMQNQFLSTCITAASSLGSEDIEMA